MSNTLKLRAGFSKAGAVSAKRSLATLCFLVVGCGSPQTNTSAPVTEPEVTEPAAEPAVAENAGGCDSQTNCESCLAQSGCSWSGGACATECMMDTYCVGPANPPAPTCSADVVILGAWQHDQSVRDGLTFVRTDRDLGPSRFRRALTFHDGTEDSDATFQTNVLAPNDGHGTAEGTWSIRGTTLTLRYPGAQPAEVFEIEHADSTTLRLRAAP